jgi:hypothetical protein
MLRSLAGVVYEIPAEVPQTVDAVRKWWAAVIGHPESRVRVERIEKEETFFGLVVPPTIVHLCPEIVHDDITDMTDFISHPQNESILKWLTSLPITAARFPLCLLACPHPIIISYLSQPGTLEQLVRLIISDEHAATTLLRNPDKHFVNTVKSLVPIVRRDHDEEDVEQFLKRPYVARVSTLHLFDTDDERLIRHMWEGLIRFARLSSRVDNKMFNLLPVNNHPVAVELILSNFDKFELFRYRFVCMCEHEEVVRRCLTKNLGNLLVRNPHPLAVKATLARFAADSHFLSENWVIALANPNPEMAEWCWNHLSSMQDRTHTITVLQERKTVIAPALMTRILESVDKICNNRIDLSWIFNSFAQDSDTELEMV